MSEGNFLWVIPGINCTCSDRILAINVSFLRRLMKIAAKRRPRSFIIVSVS